MVISRATQDPITTKTSVEQHDVKLHDLKLVWCHKKSGLFTDHVHTTFTTGSHLEAHDAK